MSSKLILLVLGLVALGALIDAKILLKNHKRSHTAIHSGASAGAKALEHVRKRRDAETSTKSEEITDEEAVALMKFFVTVAWENDKLDVLSGFLHEMTDSDTNITVIGWQRIIDDEGQVKEINTVQLVIPPKPVTEGDKSVVDNDDDDDDDEDDDRVIPYKEINELREIFEPMAQLGIPVSITMEEFDKEGEHEGLIYMDKDELYVKAEGFALYNKTAIASTEEVEAFIKNQKETILDAPAVLRYDVDGKFIEEKSSVNSHFLGSVIDHFEAPDDVLVESADIIAHIAAKYHKSEIPKHLAEAYNKRYQNYTWRVLVDPGYYYITRDVSVTVSYDNFDFDENSDVSYLVYGIKKATATE